MANIYRMHFKKLLKVYKNWFIVWIIYALILWIVKKRSIFSNFRFTFIFEKRIIGILLVLFLVPMIAAICISFAEKVIYSAKQINGQWHRRKYYKLYRTMIWISCLEYFLAALTFLRVFPTWIIAIIELGILGVGLMEAGQWNQLKKVQKGNNSKRKITEKVFCTYLITDEFFGSAEFPRLYGYDCLPDIKGVKKEKNDSFDDILAGNGEFLLCPYWFFQEAIADKKEFNEKKLIVSIDSKKLNKFSEKQIRIILGVVNQFLADGDPVMVVIDNYYDELSALQGVLMDELRKLPVKMTKGTLDAETEIEQFLLGQVKATTWTRLSELRRFCVKAEKEDKEYFISNSILNMSQDSEPADDFYRLLRMVEYCVHYRALYLVSTGKAKIHLKDGVFQPGMGEWCKMQEVDTVAGKWEPGSREVSAYGLIAELLKKPLLESINYNDICGLLKDLRNKFIGHGTMAFSVSNELLDAVAILAAVVFDVFYRDGFMLTKANKDENGIDLVFSLSSTTSLLVAIYDGESPLYEYLDYQEGAIDANRIEKRQLLYVC